MRDRPLVLIVDDEEIFLEIATIKLQMSGLAVMTAHTFSEALARAEEFLPDLILSDIYMPPGPDGWKLALAVRENPKMKDIKFAFFTSLRDPMMDLRQEERIEMEKLLKVIPVFSKTEDVGVLDKRVKDLIL